MGSFYTNVQVAGARTRVIDALRAIAAAAGLDAAAAGEPADRSFLVGPDGPWIAVYDQATEAQDERLLDALAEALSRAADARALTILVHDSDVLRLALFDHGARVARFDSDPSYFEERFPAARAPVETAPWLPLLAPGHGAAELAAIFDARALAAEGTLDALAPRFGLDRALAMTGFRYASAHPPRPLERLDFRLRVRPAHETPAIGPPRFVSAGGTERVDLELGAPIALYVSVRNTGGASSGLTVVAACAGDAIEVRRVSVLPRGGVSASFEGDRAALALAIPAGSSVDPMEAHVRGDRAAVAAALSTGVIQLELEVIARAPGKHALRITVAPDAAPGGAHAHTIHVKVR